ncbi:hypothetical protein EYC95_16120 [Pseudomonas sp. BGI-2]|nr:hypothetical protein EYC95_16120 [Pseudomonas sp. BGI-2]
MGLIDILGANLTLVGAGLLAKGPSHSTSILNVMAPSRASPLPHWICGADAICFHTGFRVSGH